MDRAPHRVEQHDGHEIKVWVVADVARGGFIGMYEVHGPNHTRSVLLDKFLVPQQAEDAALEDAKRWIDRSAN